ncbi:hypothetical protein HRbin17_02051 [bacterium HR17]|uniref:Uncharacterized protein n=1 Tax=Candidatus Fervidibacter japonicus TaxID=2035412 RepID=A0A2H5XEC0_9BACT|nr:hypothetical protein HRbin17_02051 [bacterium HR17]
MNANENIPYRIKLVTWEAFANGEGGSLEADRPSRLHSPLAHWQRIFPDRQSPNDPHQSTRRQVLLKIQIDPPLKDKQVWLRSFDVDDPSSPHDQYDPNAIIDPKDSANLDLPNDSDEGDNRGTPKTGRFIGAVDTPVVFIDERTVNVLTGEGGIAKIIFEVTMQPGDNFRIAATVDQNQLVSLAPRKRVRDGSIWFVRKDTQGKVTKWVGKVNDDTTRPAKTKASPVLTVWRRLWVEVDSMGSPPAGIQLGEDDLTTVDIPDPPLDALTEAMKDAYVEVFKVGAGYSESDTDWKYVFKAGGQGDDDIVNYCRNRRQSRNLEAIDFWVTQVVGIYEIGLVSLHPEFFSPIEEEDDPNDPAPLDPDKDDRDNDPDVRQNADGTIVAEICMNGLTEIAEPDCSFVSYEQIRDMCMQRRLQDPNTRRQMNIYSIYSGTIAHEIGHQFLGDVHSYDPKPRDLMWAHAPRGGNTDDREEEMLEQRPWLWKPEHIHAIRGIDKP